jgi:hypothetical protein
LPFISFLLGGLLTLGGYVYAYGASTRDTQNRLQVVEQKVDKLEKMYDIVVQTNNDVKWLIRLQDQQKKY